MNSLLQQPIVKVRALVRDPKKPEAAGLAGPRVELMAFDAVTSTPAQREAAAGGTFAIVSTWSTQLVFHGGSLQQGGRVHLGLRTAAALYDFQATITELRAPWTFEWLARTGVQGLFDGRHRFELTALPDGRTRLRNVERYSGRLAPIITRLPMMRSAPEGFAAMNEELRARAETA